MKAAFPLDCLFTNRADSHSAGEVLNVRSKVNVGNYMCIDSGGEMREANNVASPSSRSIHYKVQLYFAASGAVSRVTITTKKISKNLDFLIHSAFVLVNHPDLITYRP